MSLDLEKYLEAEDALYNHERPYYRYLAAGVGSDPSKSASWRRRRAYLQGEVERLRPPAPSSVRVGDLQGAFKISVIAYFIVQTFKGILSLLKPSSWRQYDFEKVDGTTFQVIDVYTGKEVCLVSEYEGELQSANRRARMICDSLNERGKRNERH